jgi:hypothetical protein
MTKSLMPPEGKTTPGIPETKDFSAGGAAVS